MRPTLLRMIAPSSLSAFSASNGVARDAAAGGISSASPIQPVRAQSQVAPGRPGSGAAQSGGPQAPPTLAPGQVLPRGSLLDLSV
jgi:hypothetical protein